MKNNENKAIGIVSFLGFFPLFIIRKTTHFDNNHTLCIHKMYWLLGFIPLFSTDTEFDSKQQSFLYKKDI